MASTASQSVKKTDLSPAQWSLLTLLVVSIFINYIDRSNLGIAAPLIASETGINPDQMGRLLSSFFWTYAGFQLFGIAGWLTDRFDVYRLFAIAFLLWSGATAVTGMVSGFGLLLLLRLILGIGESLAYPVYSRIIANQYEEHQRGIANSLIDAGSKLGPGVGTFLGGMLMQQFGWRVFFIALGVGSLVWLIPWLLSMPPQKVQAAGGDAIGPSAWEILARREAWGSFIGLFCANYFWYFLLTWLPSYLVTERGFSMERMAVTGGIAYCAIALSTTICGWLSDRLIAGGRDPIAVRRILTSFGLMFSTIILPVCIVQDHNLSLGLLLVAAMSFGVFTSSHWAMTQTLAGPAGAAKWTGLQNGVGNLAGVAAPWVTGAIVQQTGIFYLAFLVAALISLIGAAVYYFWIGTSRPVNWQTAASPAVATDLP